MTLTPVMIAPFKTGLETDLEPWMAPPDSFDDLDNIHVHHGFLEKRAGYRSFAALVPMGATVNISAITQANPGVVTTAAAHGFTTGNKVYFASVGGMTEINNKIYTITVTSVTEFSIGIDTSGLTAYTVGGTVCEIDSSTDRVMGITRYFEVGGGQTTLAFNARRAYRFGVGDIFVQLDVADIFSSSEDDFVWSTNWQSGGSTNRLYFTNGKAGSPAAAPTVDGIRYYDATVSTAVTNAFNPTLGPNRTMIGGRLLFTLGQRLIVLNTDEYNSGTATTTNHPQRARWCAKQDPSNWNDVTAGGGGYTDAATGDYIISARALQNQIIVFFSESVWSLVATPDPNRAFQWKRINNFRACDGKMASVAYDRFVIAFGLRGITATDGVETRRIDDRISDFATDSVVVDQFSKVFCERSYPNMRMWALYNDQDVTSDENNSALIYDDDSSAFSTYTIDMNCLGHGNASQDYGLDDFTEANKLDIALDGAGDDDLFSYFWQENSEVLLGGDIYGEVHYMETGGDDNGADISSTFYTAAWSPFKEEGKASQLNYVDIFADTRLTTTATIEFFKDTYVTPYATRQVVFLSNLLFIGDIISATATNPVNINVAGHGLTTGDIIYIYGCTGMININSGEASTQYTVTVVDENNVTLDGINGTTFPAYTGGGAIYRNQFRKEKTFKRVFAGGIGFQHRMRFTSAGSDQSFRIHAFRPWFKPRNRGI